MDAFRGNYVGGRFVPASGTLFSSTDPAAPQTTVFEAFSDPSAVDWAVATARAALPAWRRTPRHERVAAIQRIKDVLPRHAEGLAEAISSEMGKVLAEAQAEVRGIAGKINAIVALLDSELPAAAAGAPGEQRFHSLGVTAIVGPFNFPIHLVHTHVIPALLTGNTVVVKPSEVTPLTGQRYAQLMADAGLPDGVFNLLQGRGDVGAALVAHPDVRSIAFTGSYRTARRIREATFDQPYKKVCLELGGKNPAVILDDADPDQVVREVLLGALLTTGQRCTATSRVIATPGIAPILEARLTELLSRIQPSNPRAPGAFMGPLANEASLERYQRLLRAGREEGAHVLVESRTLPGGWYVTPGLYKVQGHERLVSEELFGPHVCFEVAHDEDDAFVRAAANPYGLSASLFSARPEAFERFYDEVPAGVMNFNRSTNGASGLLPFGGIGMSGNFNPSGSTSLRLVTYPVAVMQVPFGQITGHQALEAALDPMVGA
ncbi:MAG: succinylglutamic semialdehyde dehydrogenase [Myxococcota bacterium]|jgi:succinylglutamic semialdehyde dehydrogenase